MSRHSYGPRRRCQSPDAAAGRGRPPSDPPLRRVYAALFRHFGPQHWWPGRTRFEVIVGAILTQNTAWSNVERAIRNLRGRGWLTPAALHAAPVAALAGAIRPAGYFNVKARRLRAFTDMLHRDFGGSLDRLFRLDTAALRARLLATHGIGPETADSIALYAAGRPLFVVDAYTRRMLERHGWAVSGAPYDGIRGLFERVLPRDTTLYNEYHALIVALGKHVCRPRPACDRCPLRRFLPGGRPPERVG